MEALHAPAFPEELSYLYEWALALHGRSGVGMSGVSPLSPTVIESWSRMTHHQPNALEFEALLTLDAVLCHPEPPKERKTAEAPKPQRAWPTKKAEVA